MRCGPTPTSMQLTFTSTATWCTRTQFLWRDIEMKITKSYKPQPTPPTLYAIVNLTEAELLTIQRCIGNSPWKGSGDRTLETLWHNINAIMCVKEVQQ